MATMLIPMGYDWADEIPQIAEGDGKWVAVHPKGGHDVENISHFQLSMCGFVICLIPSMQAPGSWLLSCSPIMRYFPMGKMSEINAKNYAIQLIEQALKEASNHIGGLR